MKHYYILLFVWLAIVHTTNAQSHAKDTSTVITVYGNCDQCKHRIETAAKGKGVVSANWDIESKLLSLVYDPSKTSLDKIQQRIVQAGHDTKSRRATDESYNSLPSCCFYRNNAPVEGHDPVVKGVVMSTDSKGTFAPLANASVYWFSSKGGVFTDSSGFFVIPQDEKSNRLVISYTGYTPDTVVVADETQLKIILASGGQLKDVTVYARNRSYYASSLTPVRTQVIGEIELFKAACCNLSESFETNPSVDVSYNDAVTGTKQIQMLGLSGTYTQLTVENMPGPRGIATSNGLGLIPGPWIESIQLTKGTGSVANGFESIAGQINIEEKKPQTAESLFFNAYVNEVGKTDLNINLSKKINNRWSTGLLLHDDFLANKSMDQNKDGFRDLPTGNQLNVQNRWQYADPRGLMAQFGVRAISDSRTGGQVGFNPSVDKFTTRSYGIGLSTQRYEAFGKIGYVFPGKKYKSVGLQLSTFSHLQKDYFGLTAYDAKQQDVYANLIYQSIIGNTNHKFRTGLSLQYDHYDEMFNATGYKRKEAVPGAFFEYTWEVAPSFNMVAGVRADHNNLFGSRLTPRLNMRYQPFKTTTIRLSGGRGQRTANIFAENIGWFISSRSVHVVSGISTGAYGLQPEIAWNEGISIDQKFRLFDRDGNITTDFFRTDFNSQVVVDADQSASALYIYNLQGRSFSNSFQAEVNYSLLKQLEIRLAYRLFDVKTTYHGNLLERPLVARQRAFASVHYEAPDKWKFDYTVQFVGQKRLPYSGDNPKEFQWTSYSPSYAIMNVQVSKSFHSWDAYIGAEDLNNYYQKQPIVDAANPFSQYFDASIVWGPTFGRMLYMGVRFKVK
ncbi:MAG TPA: TonB-dependent receptor [Puia sp.]|nr:TonB-dependent receptor [Puia sp.]